jgi:hypothetical protein
MNTFTVSLLFTPSGPKAGVALVVHADANRHALLNTRKLPVYSTRRLCQQTQTLNLLVVVQGNAQWVVQQMKVGWRAGFQRLKTGTFG